MALHRDDLPEFLRPYIADQDVSRYTPIDHAGWRFIMRVSLDFFAEHAHPSYLRGLKETGVSIEQIPSIADMDMKLQRFGWRAVPVTGFIPPAVFLELLSISILPIACDMRKLEHLEYTPSPDIVHEAAGHAPFLSDKEYARYLHKFGEIARHAIFSREDLDLYQAILQLSEIKEDPRSTESDIAQAEAAVHAAYSRVSGVSEAAQVTRLGWWSTEYGLLKDGNRLLIYGAGLLSSLGESYACFSEGVEKLPLSLDCVNVNYDITKPQPQLFYVSDFAELEKVIDQLAERMAFRVGGREGTEKALDARTVTTLLLNTGLSVSGILEQCEWSCSGSAQEQLLWVKYRGPVQLSFAGEQLPGHGATYHAHGFSSPLGDVWGLNRPISQLSQDEFLALGWHQGKRMTLQFKSGIELDGVLEDVLRRNGQCLILTFADCTVRRGDLILFQPDWGRFDMACGEQVTSVYGGAADRGAYMRETNDFPVPARGQKMNLYAENQKLQPLYAMVRAERERILRSPGALDRSQMEAAYAALQRDFPGDWLLRLELLELLVASDPESGMAQQLREDLRRIAARSPIQATLIQRGLKAFALNPRD